MDRGAWWAAVHGVTQSRTRLKRLSMHAGIGEGTGNPLQCSCLENPRDGGAWWAAVMGSHRIGHDGSDSAAAIAATLHSLEIGAEGSNSLIKGLISLATNSPIFKCFPKSTSLIYTWVWSKEACYQ